MLLTTSCWLQICVHTMDKMNKTRYDRRIFHQTKTYIRNNLPFTVMVGSIQTISIRGIFMLVTENKNKNVIMSEEKMYAIQSNLY